ncbi:MAG: response regulator [Cyclobacteriaceae bacterium]
MKKTCIIVEDDPGHQDIIKFYLSNIGNIEILGLYEDTVNAVRQIEKQKPDIIFLDINISGLQGPEFLEFLEYQPQVIMVSSYPEEFMQDNFEIPYKAYLQKPINEQKLREAIDRTS